jgi:hypothetical protein
MKQLEHPSRIAFACRFRLAREVYPMPLDKGLTEVLNRCDNRGDAVHIGRLDLITSL